MASTIARPLSLLDLAHEGAVDLDRGERETAEIAQRGIAGAEIVDREPDAHGHELAQAPVDHRQGGIEEDALGDLDSIEAGGSPSRASVARTSR